MTTPVAPDTMTEVRSLEVMCPHESLRKLAQLRPLLFLQDQKRAFAPEEVRGTDLAGLMKNDTLDPAALVPFLVSAVNHLSIRVQKLEAQLIS